MNDRDAHVYVLFEMDLMEKYETIIHANISQVIDHLDNQPVLFDSSITFEIVFIEYKNGHN